MLPARKRHEASAVQGPKSQVLSRIRSVRVHCPKWFIPGRGGRNQHLHTRIKHLAALRAGGAVVRARGSEAAIPADTYAQQKKQASSLQARRSARPCSTSSALPKGAHDGFPHRRQQQGNEKGAGRAWLAVRCLCGHGSAKGLCSLGPNRATATCFSPLGVPTCFTAVSLQLPVRCAPLTYASHWMPKALMLRRPQRELLSRQQQQQQMGVARPHSCYQRPRPKIVIPPKVTLAKHKSKIKSKGTK